MMTQPHWKVVLLGRPALYPARSAWIVGWQRLLTGLMQHSGDTPQQGQTMNGWDLFACSCLLVVVAIDEVQ